MAICVCPLASAIGDISDVECVQKIDLITRLGVARATESSFATSAAFATEVAWDLALAAADGTKIQLTPRFAETELPGSTAILFGGDDNSTPNGESVITGATSPEFKAQFQNLPSDIKKEIAAMQCETDLGVYLIDASGQLIGSSPGGTIVEPIPVSAFFVGSKGAGGRTDPDKNEMRFNVTGTWDDDLVIVTPDFNILTKSN